ncbi:MAG: hypothetical protein PHD46_07195 [Eubacteriales bacterium]|nr:hypothetical protein [Eubacteriales bacterium]
MTKMTETKRINMLSKVTGTLDAVVAHAMGNPDDRGAIRMYLLGAYTVLHMTGIATTEEYDVLCEEIRTIGD